jgi:hypothetical protein
MVACLKSLLSSLLGRLLSRLVLIASPKAAGCRERISRQKVQNCERIVQELIKQEIYSNNAKLGFLLKVLE